LLLGIGNVAKHGVSGIGNLPVGHLSARHLTK
jgi:hypothetical protein